MLYEINPLSPGYTREIAVPASGAVTLTEVKEHIQIFDTESDAYLERLIIVATDLASNYIGESLSSTEYTSYYSTGNDKLLIPSRYINNTITFQYYNTSNTLSTFGTNNYILDMTNPNPIVNITGSIPAVSTEYTYPIVITYTAEIDLSIHTEAVKQAILLYVEDMWSQRGNTTDMRVSKLPLTSERLLSAARKRWA